jgi:hypothetical protein
MFASWQASKPSILVIYNLMKKNNKNLFLSLTGALGSIN